MVPLYSKLHKALKTLEFFTKNQWEWSRHNVDTLRKTLSESDKQVINMVINISVSSLELILK